MGAPQLLSYRLPRLDRALDSHGATPAARVIGERDGVRFAFAARQGREVPIDSPRKQRESLISGRGADDRRRGEGDEVGGLQKLLSAGDTVEGRVGRVVDAGAVLVDEAHEAGVFHALGLGGGGGPQHAFGDVAVGGELGGVAARGDGAEVTAGVAGGAAGVALGS